MTSHYLQRPTFFRWMLILALSATVAACGFHLRGSAKLPFKSIYLGSVTGTPVGIELKRYILASGNTLVQPTEKGAEAIMEVLSQSQEKTILTLNSQGQVREFTLHSRFSFRLVDAQKNEIMPQTDIALKRDISYNQSQELSKVAEEGLLYRDMQTDLVQQILRRIAALKPITASANTAPVSTDAITPNVPKTTPAK